jgi:hypothetical protein
VNRYIFSILPFIFGLVIAGVTGLLLSTNTLGAGWVFLIDIVSTGVFAGVRGWKPFRGNPGTGSSQQRTSSPSPSPMR